MTVREMPPILDAAERAGLLDPLDVEVALRIARLARREEAGGDVPEVALLGAAMASRALAHGHVCFEVGRAREVRPDPDGRGRPVPWEWPDAGAWLEALAACPLVRRPFEDRVSPLVLEGDLLYLDRWWGYEEHLAANLRARAAAIAPGVDADLLAEGVGRLFPDAEGAGGDDQRSAARVAVERCLSVITGGPGTGKTTTVTKILLLLLEVERRRRPDVPANRLLAISLLAPTGKAAARLEESVREVRARLVVDATGIDPDLLAAVPTEAFTIHRCLGANPDRPTRFRHDARHPLPADVVVVDEASMIDFGLMARLADAVRPEARLVLLGDRNQLASVEAGAVFGDVCDAGAAGGAVRDCVVRLRRPYRFRADGGIGALARAVNEDRPDDALACLRSGAPDLAFVPVPAGADPGATAVRAEVATAWGKGLREAVAAIVDAADAASHAAAVLRAFEHLDRFRVLCIHRRGPRGVEAANRVIPSWIHGRDAENVAGAAGTAGDWYPGLPVMVLRNDYRLDLANGDVGIVLPGFAEDRALLAHFPTADGGVRAFARGRLPPHEPVHAMTVHKSQGSQFGTVLLLLPEEPSPLVTRELVYTAVTRARDRVVVAGSEAVLAAAIRLPIRRASGLKAKL